MLHAVRSNSGEHRSYRVDRIWLFATRRIILPGLLQSISMPSGRIQPIFIPAQGLPQLLHGLEFLSRGHLLDGQHSHGMGPRAGLGTGTESNPAKGDKSLINVD